MLLDNQEIVFLKSQLFDSEGFAHKATHNNGYNTVRAGKIRNIYVRNNIQMTIKMKVTGPGIKEKQKFELIL